MMQPTPKRSIDSKLTRKEKIKDESPLTSRKTLDDKLKRSSITPRDYLQKTSTADIYAQNKTSVTKTPKKVSGTSITSNVSPMKGLLKSTPSTATVQSVRSTISTFRDPKTPRTVTKKIEPKVVEPNRNLKTKKQPLTSVTVNSPITKRKTIESVEKTLNTAHKDERTKTDKEIDRQRTQTRTLGENETKILKKDAVDNNKEMKNLSAKLNAKPKAFYVNLDESKSKYTYELQPNKQSDEEVSYEDDFESYESDFESDHSDETEQKSSSNDTNDGVADTQSIDSAEGSKSENETMIKEIRDEEKMLDSGNFDLRDPQKSAQRSKPMAHISEDAEDHTDKKVSLTDEGFQEMSSSSAACSLKTMHVDVLERPLFIDFSKSKDIKRKKRQTEIYKQRAKDLLSVITLHSMSYSLFELKPIPYDVYMTTFGRSNYTQAWCQTFDDGMNNETQTDIIEQQTKWTQGPVEFSISDICITNESKTNKRKATEGSLSKFAFLDAVDIDLDANKENGDDNYKKNPLRIYLEQKDGVGSDGMLPYHKYKLKFQENEYNMDRLRKFIKKTGRRVINILSSNSFMTRVDNKSSKYPFSAGFSSISPALINNKDLQFVKFSKITKTIFSETKSNLVFTIHQKLSNGILSEKSLICLWDLNMALDEPLKILITVNDVSLAKFRGGSDGIFIAALEDGSIHLWDLTEHATWLPTDDNEENKTTQLQEVDKSEEMTQAEIDREWNLKNSNVGLKESRIQRALQSCAFTSSARNMMDFGQGNTVVGMQFLDDAERDMGGGQKTIGQICTLQEHGIFTIWSIVQEKSKCLTKDIGKAYWSKLSLEKATETILSDYIDSLVFGVKVNSVFNLNAAKKRLTKRKHEKGFDTEVLRPKSGSSFDSSSTDRPWSAASRKSRNSAKITNDSNDSLICNDLKTMTFDNVVNFLIAKNCGEVLRCTRCFSDFKVDRVCVTNDTSSVICLDVSQNGLPYFLAATDSGTVHLCSLVESRVLLTLDCRNGPPVPEMERYQSDSKGRFIATVTPKKNSFVSDKKAQIKSVHWLRSNPCSIVVISQDGAISEWQLDRSDICPSYTKQYHVISCTQASNYLSLVLADGTVEIHNLSYKQNLASTLQLFQKYVNLL